MWAQAESDLQRLLIADVYPALLRDRYYRDFLVFAGFKPGEAESRTISSAVRKTWPIIARIRAHIIVSEIEKQDAIDDRSSGAVLLEGPLDLYRFWDSTSPPDRREGIWWFDRKVLDLCKQQTVRSADARAEWLRSHLAVSKNFNKMDRIDHLSLKEKTCVPAIVGVGKKKPVWTPSAVSFEPSAESLKNPPIAKTGPKEYFEEFGRYFPGGVRQIILPFVPEFSGEDRNRFLSKA